MAKRDIREVASLIILSPFFLLWLLLSVISLFIFPLFAIWSIPIDILLFPFVKKKWPATKRLYEEVLDLERYYLWEMTEMMSDIKGVPWRERV